MVGSQDAGAVFEGLFVQGDGFVEPVRVSVDVGEFISGSEGVGVVSAKGVDLCSEG